MTARPAYLRMRPAPDDSGRSPAAARRLVALAPETLHKTVSEDLVKLVPPHEAIFILFALPAGLV